MAERYYTCMQIQRGLKECGAPPTVTFNRIKGYADSAGLLKHIEDLDVADNVKDACVKSKTVYFVSQYDLQTILEGLEIPVKLSKLKSALSKSGLAKT